MNGVGGGFRILSDSNIYNIFIITFFDFFHAKLLSW